MDNNNNTAQKVVEELIAGGEILPEYRDIAVNHLDSELKRYTKALTSRIASESAKSLFLGMIFGNRENGAAILAS